MQACGRAFISAEAWDLWCCISGTWHVTADGQRLSYSLVNNTAPELSIPAQYSAPGLLPGLKPGRAAGAAGAAGVDAYDPCIAHFMSLCMKLVYEKEAVIQVGWCCAPKQASSSTPATLRRALRVAVHEAGVREGGGHPGGWRPCPKQEPSSTPATPASRTSLCMKLVYEKEAVIQVGSAMPCGSTRSCPSRASTMCHGGLLRDLGKSNILGDRSSRRLLRVPHCKWHELSRQRKPSPMEEKQQLGSWCSTACRDWA